jgi:single-stranded DNA-binding protein
MILRWKKDGLTLAIGTGRLTRNPEVKHVGEKNSLLAKLGVAVNEGEEAEYASLDCWRRQAEYARNLEKADDVFFVGIEKTRTYEGKDGEEKTATSIDVKYLAAQMSVAVDEPKGGHHNSSASKDGAVQELPDDSDMPF